MPLSLILVEIGPLDLYGKRWVEPLCRKLGPVEIGNLKERHLQVFGGVRRLIAMICNAVERNRTLTSDLILLAVNGFNAAAQRRDLFVYVFALLIQLLYSFMGRLQPACIIDSHLERKSSHLTITMQAKCDNRPGDEVIADAESEIRSSAG